VKASCESILSWFDRITKNFGSLDPSELWLLDDHGLGSVEVGITVDHDHLPGSGRADFPNPAAITDADADYEIAAGRSDERGLSLEEKTVRPTRTSTDRQPRVDSQG
jgi:hypothetical protein